MDARRSLGLLGPNRLGLVPSRYWREHEFCFHLHDRILEFVVQYEASGAHNWVSEAFELAVAEGGAESAEVDLLTFLKDHGHIKHYQHHIVSHLVLGLTTDMLHFLFEALTCFETRKFAVAFALLRKPLKENLLFLSWLLADRDDFISRFEKDTYTTLNGLQPVDRLRIFEGAIARLATNEAFAPDLLDGLIFSKTNPRSFEPIWQRASHLITSQGSLLRTEDLNINFIFHDSDSDSLYELLYANLPYVLLFAVQVALESFARLTRANEQTVSHLIMSTMGTFECLFRQRTERGVTALFGRTLRPFLKCIHCAAQIRLTRDNAIDMYLHETLTCRACSLSSPFPLYWLMAKAKVSISRDGSGSPILEES